MLPDRSLEDCDPFAASEWSSICNVSIIPEVASVFVGLSQVTPEAGDFQSSNPDFWGIGDGVTRSFIHNSADEDNIGISENGWEGAECIKQLASNREIARVSVVSFLYMTGENVVVLLRLIFGH